MSGRAVILRVDTPIAPFGEPARDAMFTHETIAETHDFVCASAGLEVVRVETAAEAVEAIRGQVGPVVLFLDRIYVSEKALKDFIKAATTATRPAALKLEVNASVEYTLPLQDVLRHDGGIVHDVYLVDGAVLPDPEDDTLTWVRRVRDSATPVVVEKREIVAEIPLPVIGERGGTMMRYPVTSTVVVSIEHWLHILWLNQIAFGIRWMELIRRKPLWAAWRACTALSLNPEKILGRLVRRGKNTHVHPTAYLSGSILGDDVSVGAHATIRNSIIGAGAHIQDHAVVLNSVVGPRCLITENTFVVSVCIYPEATVGNYKLQVTLIGRQAYVNAWAGFVDAKFVGHVKVEHKGELVSSERAFVGSVVGHRAKVAAKVMIHPGREIPNDTVIVMRPDEVVSVVPESIAAGTPLVRDRGTLVPLGTETRTR